MTATEELRRILDERGVEWGNFRNDGSESDYLTEWQLEDNQGKVIATEWAVGSGLSVEIHRYHLTPEQAIAATLGRERTCTLIPTRGKKYRPHVPTLTCSNCGAVYELSEAYPSETLYGFAYCSNCGAKVVER